MNDIKKMKIKMKLKNNKKNKIHHEMLFLEEQVYTGIFFEFTGRLDWLSWSKRNRLVPGAKTIKTLILSDLQVI